MAIAQAPSIGNSMVTSAVISVASTMPVSGARTTPVNKSGHPHHGESFRLNVEARKCELAGEAEEQSKLRPEREHRETNASARGSGRIGGAPRART